MRKRMISITLAALLAAGLLAGCGSAGSSPSSSSAGEETEKAEAVEAVETVTEEQKEEKETGTDQTEAAAETEQAGTEEAEVIVFAAKSLNKVLDDLIALYQEDHPDVTFATNYDSSGTLMTQIDEGGAPCDVFFSAAQSQMNTLEEKGLVAEGTRKNVVNNQVCVVTYKGSTTEVTGLMDMDKAKSLALADGSVPVGKYTRQAMVSAGILLETEDVAAITSQEISEALGGVTINECANVGAVASAVAEQSDEVGTVYYSDTFGYEDQLEILEIVSYDLTGNVIYPVGQIVNTEATNAQILAAKDFIDFLTSDAAKAVFDAYHFDTNVE